MFLNHSPLPSHPLAEGTDFARPVQSFREPVRLADPALDAMTDLRRVSLVDVRAHTSVEKANARMIRYGVRLLLVLDDHRDHVAGLLTASDVLGEKPVAMLGAFGGTWASLTVRDIMTPARDVEVLALEDVNRATVGQIVATLKAKRRHHALVASTGADGRSAVCGIFSITQIARQLGVDARGFDLRKTLAEIEAAVSAANS